MDFWVGLCGFAARDWFDDVGGRRGRLLLLLLVVVVVLLLDEEGATDFEGARHMEDMSGKEDVVDVGEVEV